MLEEMNAETQPVSLSRKSRVIIIIILVLFGLSALSASAFLGGYRGYRQAENEQQLIINTAEAQMLLDQYTLGVQNLESGEYDLARQRFEYVLANDPNFPGVSDKLAAALQVLYATATPTPAPSPSPTPTLTTTPDLRPVEDLFSQAKSLFEDKDWSGTIEALLVLRNVDIEYKVVEVDALLYQALRNRGVEKIRDESNLEGGIYDLALAEKYAPIDSQATTYRNVARIYMIGLGFWEVYPEQAIYYFQQVASAAPYLLDASGWTARERYRAVLIQYADQLADMEEWCEAEEYYLLAISIRSEFSLEENLAFVSIQCSPPTATPAPVTNTPTITVTSTFVVLPTDTPPTPATPTQEINPPTATVSIPTATTEAPIISATPTLTPVPTEEIPPTETPIPEPSSTPTPTIMPLPTDTVAPTATVTDTLQVSAIDVTIMDSSGEIDHYGGAR